MLAFHKQEQALFSYLQYRACPAAFDGKAWGIMGAAVEGHLDTGHVVGSVSGHLYRVAAPRDSGRGSSFRRRCRASRTTT